MSYKFAESCALGPLYQLTTETKVALRDLAAQTEIPYMSIGFTKGISGSGEQVEAFGRELAEIHRVGLMANNGTGAPFRSLVQPLAHGDLLNPDVTAGHVAFTLALTEANLREGFDLFPLA